MPRHAPARSPSLHRMSHQTEISHPTLLREGTYCASTSTMHGHRFQEIQETAVTGAHGGEAGWEAHQAVLLALLGCFWPVSACAVDAGSLGETT